MATLEKRVQALESARTEKPEEAFDYSIFTCDELLEMEKLFTDNNAASFADMPSAAQERLNEIVDHATARNTKKAEQCNEH